MVNGWQKSRMRWRLKRGLKARNNLCPSFRKKILQIIDDAWILQQRDGVRAKRQKQYASIPHYRCISDLARKHNLPPQFVRNEHPVKKMPFYYW
jgi:hypothetical protein